MVNRFDTAHVPAGYRSSDFRRTGRLLTSSNPVRAATGLVVGLAISLGLWAVLAMGVVVLVE